MERGRDVGLHAEDGLDPLPLAGLVKIDHAVHHAVVGDGQRILAERLGARDQLVDARRAVEQAVLRMHMQMDKRGHGQLLVRARRHALRRGVTG